MWYLIRIDQFGDFEVEQQEKVVSRSFFKSKLISMCKRNGWTCTGTTTAAKNGWDEYYVKWFWWWPKRMSLVV